MNCPSCNCQEELFNGKTFEMVEWIYYFHAFEKINNDWSSILPLTCFMKTNMDKTSMITWPFRILWFPQHQKWGDYSWHKWGFAKENQIKIYSCGIKSCDKGYLPPIFCDCHKIDNVLMVEQYLYKLIVDPCISFLQWDF